ncbi:putative ribonuclease H protein [Vitis vinifera]|uniref:Putative ribonuclease H protein n=1 Tax=Vitis vinifera TaxID=29760 RepID=A0A438D9I7_VITVI|nr:putative ribonuclease H protein [Vitis vinifera]
MASIPLYQMSLFRMPKSVARRLEKLQRDFCGEGQWGEKSTLSQVEMVCADKEKGGLGLRKFACLNKALLGKWIWRFARAKEDLWKKVLEAKYGQEDFGWRTRKANGVFGVGVWKDILKESAWCWENMVFKECHSGGNMGSEFWSRRVEFKVLRAFNDWELDMVGNLLVELREYRVTLEEHSVIWKEGGDGLFRVKKAYSVLASPIVAEFPL